MKLEYIQKAIQDNKTERFYEHREWRRKKQEVLKKFHYECQECKKQNKLTRATIVHHVKHLRRYPSLALSDYYYDKEGKQHVQLMPLCFQCHEKIHGRGKKEIEDKWNDEKW